MKTGQRDERCDRQRRDARLPTSLCKREHVERMDDRRLEARSTQCSPSRFRTVLRSSIVLQFRREFIDKSLTLPVFEFLNELSQLSR